MSWTAWTWWIALVLLTSAAISIWLGPQYLRNAALRVYYAVLFVIGIHD